MDVTLEIDDRLVARAEALTGLVDRAELVREALLAVIERESSRRLARMGGREPGAMLTPRGRSA